MQDRIFQENSDQDFFGEHFFVHLRRIVMIFFCASAAIHFCAIIVMHYVLRGHQVKPTHERLHVKIKTAEAEEEKPKTAPEPPKPKPSPKAPQPKPESRQEKKKPPQTPPPRVQGLTSDSTVENSNVAAPLGNTLMVEDRGKRLRPEEVASLKKNLAADATLILDTFVKPQYTQAALDANLEGAFIIDVYVDEQGHVSQAELRKKIGFGMDERLIAAILKSRYVPRKNEQGIPMAGWAETKVTLQID